MPDATEKNRHSDASVSGETSLKPSSLPKDALSADAGPGLVGVELSTIKEHLRDLDTDKSLPPEERDKHRLLYTHRCNELQLLLTVLQQRERVQKTEGAREEARRAVEFVQSGGHQLADSSPNNELTNAESYLADVEALLESARSELQALLSSLEHLRIYRNSNQCGIFVFDFPNDQELR